MRYIYQRGAGAIRRRMHICGHDPRTGQPTMQPLCGERRVAFDTSINPPWALGFGVCKKCTDHTRKSSAEEQP